MFVQHLIKIVLTYTKKYVKIYTTKNKRIREGKPTEPERKKDYDNRDYDERAFL